MTQRLKQIPKPNPWLQQKNESQESKANESEVQPSADDVKKADADGETATAPSKLESDQAEATAEATKSPEEVANKADGTPKEVESDKQLEQPGSEQKEEQSTQTAAA